MEGLLSASHEAFIYVSILNSFDIANQEFMWQAMKYTGKEKKQSRTTNAWSKEGVEKFCSLFSMVKEQRLSLKGTQKNERPTYFTWDDTRVAKMPRRKEPPKEIPVEEEDMGGLWSDKEAVDDDDGDERAGGKRKACSGDSDEEKNDNIGDNESIY